MGGRAREEREKGMIWKPRRQERQERKEERREAVISLTTTD